ncbi:MAG TPA: HPr-rel-A system PqqD family peptide chaperone [Allosphingosinicella sp.]|jgi:PqqD family protein of HPr-rel-A system
MAGPRYIADFPDAVKIVPLDGLVAFFHRPSGMTHILAPPAPEILEALAGRAGDAGEVLARIAERFDLESDDAEAAIAARLAELEAAGLVRPA